MEDQKIGFLSLCNTNKEESYVGALLVCDEYGIPLEFKCTHAVRPTAIQKTLYGDKLKPYIANNLCGIPLLQSVSIKPDLLFIDKMYMLELRTIIDTATLLVKSVDDVINLHSNEEKKEWKRYQGKSEEFKPIMIETLPKYYYDIESSNEKVEQLLKNFDLIEPFERIKKSVEILGRKDDNFK